MDKKNISKADKQKANRLRGVRISNRLTQEKMAERLDVAYSTYQRMESGRNNITISHLEKLNKKFGVSADYILFGKINDEKHFELEFEGSDNKAKFSMLLRLMAHLCNLSPDAYEKLLKDVEKYIR